MASLFTELKHRNVFRVGVACLVGIWVVVQVVDILFPRMSFSDWVFSFVMTLAAIGFVPTMIFSWVFQLTPEGIKKEKDVDRGQSIAPRQFVCKLEATL